MKINKIYLKNINSFKGEHRIDFSEKPLSVSGLFAIVGQTGAGKSTLLDAITLAIFNRIPRFEKQLSKNFVASTGSVLTRGERECAVEVEFSCKSGNFISKWRIEMNRNQNLNDYEMEIFDLKTQTLLPYKKGDIPAKNEELIGLTYDQFIKSILLSQGEFSKFLKSGKDDRGKLLEDITGTQIYRKLGKKAFEVAKEKTELLKQFRSNIAIEKCKLSSEENEQNWLTKKTEIDKLLKTLQENLATIKTKIELKNVISALENSIQEKVNKQKFAKEALQNFELNESNQLQNHDKAEPFQRQILTLQNQENELANLKNRLVKEEEITSKNEVLLKDCFSKLKNLVKSKEEITVENALIFLQNFREKHHLLNKNKSELEGQKRSNENQINEVIQKLAIHALTINSKELSEESLEKIKVFGIENKKTLQEALNAADIQEIEQIQGKRDKLTLEYRNFNELKRCIIEYTRLADEKKNEEFQLKEQQELVNKITPEFKKKQLQRPLIEEKIKVLEIEKSRLSDAYNFEKNRQLLLKKDEPCPLCGSLEHPYLNHYANNYVEIDLALAASKEEEKELVSAINNLKVKIDFSTQIITKTTEKLAFLKTDIDKIFEEITVIKNNLEIEKVGNKESIDNQLRTIENVQNLLNGLEKKAQKLKDLQFLYQLGKNTFTLQQDYNKIFKESNDLYSGNNFERDCNEIQTNFSTFHLTIQSSKRAILSLKEETVPKEQTFISEKNALESKIKQNGFGSIIDCQKAILLSETAKILRDKKQSLLIIIKTLDEQVNEQRNELQKNSFTDDKFVSLENLLENQHNSTQEEVKLKKDQIELDVTIITQQKIKAIISNLENQLITVEKDNLKWELLDKYIGDATGKKFGTFAQGLTLNRLIALSNRRLLELSDRYLLDKPSEQEEDELMIIDSYMGNEMRSVKTLSGGETFLISLSMALALSDLASKNIKLESLFIDEGFGTLDPETLDLALSTLEKIQQEGQKNIGIISHVESIKERISTQIRLERNNRGFSRIEFI